MVNCIYNFFLNNLENFLRILQILTTIFLALFIPLKIQKFIGNRNLIKESLKNDLEDLIKIIINIQDELRKSKSSKKNYFKSIMPLTRDMGFAIDFIFHDLQSKVDLIKKKKYQKLKEEIKKKHLSYKKMLTNDLPKKDFKVEIKFLHQCEQRKDILIKELKLFIYEILTK